MHEYNYFAAFYMFEINSTNTTKLKHQPCTLDVTAKKLAVNRLFLLMPHFILL